MQIGFNSSYNAGNSAYAIKLNEKEMLIIEEDPLSKELAKTKKEKKAQENAIEQAQKSNKSSDPNELSESEKKLTEDLASRDAQVRAHESAHQSNAGGLAGAASYTYQQGPDGKLYAIGGEVPISTPTSSTPEEAIANARKITAAAMAAASPSPQDFAVASSAKMMEAQARQQKNQEMQKQQTGIATYSNEMNNSLQKGEEKRDSFNISA